MRYLVFALLLTCGLASNAASQMPDPGSRVRATYWASGPTTTVGVLASFGSDTLALKPDNAAESLVRVHLASIGRLEVSTGSHNRAGGGALIGGLLGGTIGALLSAAAVQLGCGWGDDGCPARMHGARIALQGAVGGAALGALFGYLLGSKSISEGWQRVTLPEPTPR
jgi:hypothetical protein